MKPRDRAYIQQQIIEQMIESLAQSKASSNGWNWNDLPEEPKTLFDGCPNKNYYRRRVKDVLTFLGSWGLGFYETDSINKN